LTKRDIVSQVANILKTLNKDNRFSRRFILRTLEDSAEFLISQKWGERSLLSETNLYTNIPCFEFKKIDIKECPSIEFRLCKTLMKSKKPLPKPIFSRLGASIKDVVSMDGEFTFTFVDEAQYRRSKKRQHKLKNEVYIYLGVDGHLYIPDKEIFSIDLNVLSTDTIAAEDCSECKEKDACKNNWDYPFIINSRLIEAVKDMSLQRLGISRQIQSDNNPNSVEGN
jgi:hypothetical protein